jgi:endoribonuclease Dicer
MIANVISIHHLLGLADILFFSASSEKKRAQNAIFRSFANVKTSQITEKEVKDTLKNTRDELLSIQDILARQENSSRIYNPRDYQTELFQRAKEENIIAVLGTGSGKTHIATMLIRHILDLEVEDRAKGAREKITFFLVNSVNLVFQQSNVLRCGLDHSVEGICGAMGTSLWQKKTWDDHFKKHKVIVCTAEVLAQCLMHSFINISRINLLIFDEAHHAKNNHPFARIMKDYYLAEPDLSKRPRIFGMTASPVDANTIIEDTAKQLEQLLHCKIATTSDTTLIANSINKPIEEIANYAKLPEPYETPLHRELKSRYGDLPGFEKLFRISKLFASELGRWASDAYWSFAFTEQESRKREIRHEFKYHKTLDQGGMDKLNEQIARLKEAAEYVQKHDFGSPSPTPDDLSSKVLVLHDWLKQYYHRHGNHRCIVFVEQRQTARLLLLVFKHLGGPHLHSDMLVGNSSNVGEFNISLRSQVMTVAKFRKGELNCLFSTSVAEEGLDIPQCNLIVRFNLYRTMIAYVQSRGRARHQNSKYLHMVEKGNQNHLASVWEARSAEKTMKDFCGGLSRDRLLNELDSMISDMTDLDPECETYTNPDTGAKLTFKSSLSVLGHFVNCLPAPTLEAIQQPTYVMNHVALEDNIGISAQGGFQCEVILPEYSPIISMVGKTCRRKALAKCSAAFEMCRALLEKKELDENLLPTNRKELPKMRNAQLALSEKKKDQYPMRLKPDFWQINYDSIPECLYLTVIDMESGLDRPHQPLGLLTRTPLPQLPQFPVYLRDDRPSMVVSIPLTKSLRATHKNLEQFTTLFRILYEDIFNKEYEHDVAKWPYWQVPIRLDRIGSISASSDPEDVIDMDQVQKVCDVREHRWSHASTPDDLSDKYFVDRGNGGRRFYSIRLVADMKALDPVPSSAPAYKYCKNILDYSVSLWKTARERAKWDESQPVVQAERIPFRRNFLAAVDSKEESEIRGNNVAFVCPEPFRISSVSLFIYPDHL